MNIESSNALSLVSSNATSVTGSATAESQSQPLSTGNISTDGFSGALVTQIGLLNTAKPIEPQTMPETHLAALPVVNTPQGVVQAPVAKANPQEFAALIGNDLPSTSKMAGSVDHEAVLVAVTDTLKYLAMGSSTSEKVTVAEQNLKKVMAMATPVTQEQPNVRVMTDSVEQDLLSPVAQHAIDPMATAAPVERHVTELMATVAPIDQHLEEVMVTAAPVEPIINESTAVAVPVTPSQNDSVLVSIGQKSKDGAKTVLQTPKNVVARPISVNQNQKGAITKLVSTGQNLGDAAAMPVLLDTHTKDITAKRGEVAQNQQDAVTTAVLDDSGSKAKAVKVASVGQSNNDVMAKLVSPDPSPKQVAMGSNPRPIKDMTAIIVPTAKQNKQGISVRAKQNKGNEAALAPQVMKEATTIAAPVQSVQMDVKWANNKSDKQQLEEQAPIDNASHEESALVASVPPVSMPIEQGRATNQLPADDRVKESGLLSFVKPSTEDIKFNPSTKTSKNAQQSEVSFRQPTQARQDFNVKYADNAAQPEKTGLVERQALSAEGDKALPRVGMDIAPPSRLVDNKVDIPPITKPLSHPEWNKELGDRIVWMSNRAIPTAEIRLNPQHLGPISVRVDVVDDQATVVFTAQHALTREALESSVPKLREMMSVQHLHLVDVSVSHGSASDQGRSQAQNFSQTTDSRGQAAGGGAVEVIDDLEQDVESEQAIVSNGLLSLYA